MRNLELKMQLCLLLLALFSFSSELLAEGTAKSRLPLHNGMTLSEVAAVWGEPADVIEYSLQKQVQWYFPALRNAPASTLIFYNGSLSNLKQHKPVIALDNHGQPQKIKEPKSEDSGKAKSYSFMALENQKMLAEILRDVPSAPDGPAAAGAATAPVSPVSPAQFE